MLHTHLPRHLGDIIHALEAKLKLLKENIDTKLTIPSTNHREDLVPSSDLVCFDLNIHLGRGPNVTKETEEKYRNELLFVIGSDRKQHNLMFENITTNHDLLATWQRFEKQNIHYICSFGQVGLDFFDFFGVTKTDNTLHTLNWTAIDQSTAEFVLQDQKGQSIPLRRTANSDGTYTVLFNQQEYIVLHFDMVDMSTLTLNPKQIKSLYQLLLKQAYDNAGLYEHCKMGLGRTGNAFLAEYIFYSEAFPHLTIESFPFYPSTNGTNKLLSFLDQIRAFRNHLVLHEGQLIDAGHLSVALLEMHLEKLKIKYEALQKDEVALNLLTCSHKITEINKQTSDVEKLKALSAVVRDILMSDKTIQLTVWNQLKLFAIDILVNSKSIKDSNPSADFISAAKTTMKLINMLGAEVTTRMDDFIFRDSQGNDLSNKIFALEHHQHLQMTKNLTELENYLSCNLLEEKNDVTKHKVDSVIEKIKNIYKEQYFSTYLDNLLTVYFNDSTWPSVNRSTFKETHDLLFSDQNIQLKKQKLFFLKSYLTMIQSKRKTLTQQVTHTKEMQDHIKERILTILIHEKKLLEKSGEFLCHAKFLKPDLDMPANWIDWFPNRLGQIKAIEEMLTQKTSEPSQDAGTTSECQTAAKEVQELSGYLACLEELTLFSKKPLEEKNLISHGDINEIVIRLTSICDDMDAKKTLESKSILMTPMQRLELELGYCNKILDAFAFTETLSVDSRYRFQRADYLAKLNEVKDKKTEISDALQSLSQMKIEANGPGNLGLFAQPVANADSTHASLSSSPGSAP